MAKLIIFALGLLAGLACSTPAPRIAGGKPTTVSEYPSIVQVESGSTSNIWTQSCGGNILTARYILSAAHCFHGIWYDPTNRRIRAGTTIRGYGGQVAYVDTEINHPTYGVNDMDGDLSVVRLLTSLVYGIYVQQGIIITQGYEIPAGFPVHQAGWGASQIGGLPSNELQKAEIFTIDRKLCAERYAGLSIPRAVTDNMICAGILNIGGGDSCQGDYGGPLYYGQILVGIQSWGEGCGNKTLPGVNTAVSSYTTWITEAAI